MIDLGKKSEMFGAELLQPVTSVFSLGRPSRMPVLPSASHRVICGYNQGVGEHMIVCESLEEMKQLYDAYASGGAISINWYIGDDRVLSRS